MYKILYSERRLRRNILTTYISIVRVSPPSSIGRTNTLEKLYRSAYHPRFVPLFNNAPPSSLYDPVLCDFQEKENSYYWWRQSASNTVNKYNLHETCIHLIRMAVLCTKMFAVLLSAALRRDSTSNDKNPTMNFTHDAAVAFRMGKVAFVRPYGTRVCTPKCSTFNFGNL